MKTLFDLPAFSVGRKQYYWQDVIFAAMAWGDWDILKEEVRRGLACAKRMRDTGESPTDEEMNWAIKKFRYEYELITTEDAESWLKHWGLNSVDWMKYICISILRKRWEGQLSDILSDFSVTDEEVDLNIKAEAICSGQLVSFCRKLAAKLSIYEKEKEEKAINGSRVSRENKIKALLKIFSANLKKSGEIGLSPEVCSKKLETLACVDLCFQHYCKKAFTPEMINEQIRFNNFDWIRIDCLHVSFPEEQMAREAIFCIKKDGEEFSSVAARVKSHIQKSHYYLDQVDSLMHSHFLHAQKGELIGPLDLAGKPTLFLICEKVMPSEQDPYIRERAKEKILKNSINYEIHNRVHWETGFYKE